jgi:hypothetical protein
MPWATLLKRFAYLSWGKNDCTSRADPLLADYVPCQKR